MLNSFTKLIILFLMIIISLISKSLESNMIIFILTLIIILKSNVSISKYLNNLKKHKIIILFILFTIIIDIFLFIKLTSITLLILLYTLVINKKDIYNDISYILKPLNIFNINIDKIVINIMFYQKIFFSETNKYIKYLISKNKYKFNILLIINKTKTKISKLYNKFYQYKRIKLDLNNYILIFVFILYLFITIYKEVII